MAKNVTNLKVDEYLSFRQQFLADEESKTIGASLTLSKQEEIVNELLLQEKWKELDIVLKHPKCCLASQHVFDIVSCMETSHVFQLIQILPKGCSLHSHDLALVSSDYVVSLTFTENLYACLVDGRIKLKFMQDGSQDNSDSWCKINELRKCMSNFDSILRSQLTLIHPENKFMDNNTIWKKFTDCFSTVEPLITYKPIFKKYFYEALEELYEDNVMYLEFRTILPTVYDLTGRLYEADEVAGLYKEVADDFMRTHPDFVGVKMIYAPVRSGDDETISQYIATTRLLKNKYPNFFAGFDLVGQEDMGVTLLDIFEKLYDLKEEVDFFFHAGETNCCGTKIDFNIVDAILLNTKRIGHAFSLLRHVNVLEATKQNEIAIECCPISNQILMGLHDLRQHPVTYLIAKDYPVVICNDDPTFWGTKGLSYDWYMAFMTMTGRNVGLRFLKQLAINSIKYSACVDKEQAFRIWEKKWQEFIEKVLSIYANHDHSKDCQPSNNMPE